MRRFIGLDVHRDYSCSYVLEAGQEQGSRRRFPNTAEEWAGFVEELGPDDAVAIEVSGGTFRLYDTLADRAGQVVAVDPRVMRRLGSRKRKTDHDDAKVLAERLALGTLPGVWVPPKPLRELRALVNLRRRLVEQRARWKNQIRSLLQRYGYRAPHSLWQARRHVTALFELDLSPADRVALAVALEQLRSTNTHLRALEREIGQRVKDCPPVRLLLSLPGFNVIAAATYYAYIGDPFRFPTDKHVASYTGLVPRVYQSGTTDRRGSITKEGPAVLRWTLVEAASSVARHGPPALRAFYQRLRAKKGHQVAVVALAAKLTVFLYAAGTALCTGLGAIPFLAARSVPRSWLGTMNATAAGLMLAASFGLVYEGIGYSLARLTFGALLGLAFITWSSRVLHRYRNLTLGNLHGLDARKAFLVVGIMTLHSFTEGVGVGVSFGGGQSLGTFITLAIAVHNIPEGLAISLVLVPRGVPVWVAAGWSVFSSLPQPLMAPAAYLFVETFRAHLPTGLGFAAGAMIWMVFSELIPDALKDASHGAVATAVTLTSLAMVVFQTLIKT